MSWVAAEKLMGQMHDLGACMHACTTPLDWIVGSYSLLIARKELKPTSQNPQKTRIPQSSYCPTSHRFQNEKSDKSSLFIGSLHIFSFWKAFPPSIRAHCQDHDDWAPTYKTEVMIDGLHIRFVFWAVHVYGLRFGSTIRVCACVCVCVCVCVCCVSQSLTLRERVCVCVRARDENMHACMHTHTYLTHFICVFEEDWPNHIDT